MSDKRIENEIAHGKVLKEQWKGVPYYLGTPAGKRRLERRADFFCSHIKPDDKVLEVGAGSGFYTEKLVGTGAHITALDVSPDLLNLAQERIKAQNVSFCEGNAYNLKFPDEFFNVVGGSSVLHHLDLHKALNEFHRVLKPGGVICFPEPNYLNPHIFLERHVPYLRKKLLISPDEKAFFHWRLKKDLEQHGYDNISIQLRDFLHPLTPPAFINTIQSISCFLERIPIIKEIAGSLYIFARRS